jgi:hypothetical protein
MMGASAAGIGGRVLWALLRGTSPSVNARQKARSGGVKREIIALANMVFPEF